MPELPEVENVRLSLQASGSIGQKITAVEFMRSGLRTPFPKNFEKVVVGQTVLQVHRRAKYLLFETEAFIILNHLGMTGSWRLLRELQRDEIQKHDHIVIGLESGINMIFNDPRRFGILDLVKKEKLLESRWLKHLGQEPLEPDFHGDFLFSQTRKRTAPIKAFLMDQRQVVGVGNIYASEALHAAGIRPTRQAGKISRAEAESLVQHIRRILEAAIAAGGSTIRDYRNSNGDDGHFQNQFLVYDRAQSPCAKCGAPIKSKFIAGRNTFWCSKCQH